MTEASGAMPSYVEASSWIGAEVADVDGTVAGAVEGFFVDVDSAQPAWLIVRFGRRRHTRLVAVPVRDCAGAPAGVWVAHDAAALRTAPVVDPTRPLRREHELTICEHFGIAEGAGRAAEVAAKVEGEVTSRPPSAD